MNEHCNWMEKTFSFCFIQLCVPCSLCFSPCWFYLLCATLDWPQNMVANEKGGIGWALVCQSGVHFRSGARSSRSHLPPCEDVSEVLSMCWWVIWNYFQHAHRGRWKMTPPTEKGLHAKTSLLLLCLTDSHPPPAVFSWGLSFCTFSCFNTKVLIIKLFSGPLLFPWLAFSSPITLCSLLIDVIFHTDIRLHLFP